MSRSHWKLSPAFVSHVKDHPEKHVGMHADGDGLYLQAASNGASWIYRFMLHGRRREMGLGSLRVVSLKGARQKAEECRRLCDAGTDPIAAREAERQAAALAAAKAITFKDAAEQFIAAHRAGWKNAKHANQWKNTLACYVYPIIGAVAVQDVDVALVMKVLEQDVPAAKGKPAGKLWTARPETASRVRGRIESILDWANARGYRQGDNPARWRGHLENLLPARAKVRRVRHHPALPYTEMGAFMDALRHQDGIAARALEFTILTAARTTEVICAKWGEFDLGAAVWTVPADRMKADKEHRVPLSGAAIAILREMRKKRQMSEGQDEAEAYVFPGRKKGKHLSNMAMLELMRDMKRTDGKPWSDRNGHAAVPHGFRSTFRDWAAECTNYPRDVAEMALAHAVSDKTEAAYRRGDLFEQRRRLMNEWAAFCGTVAPRKGSNVTTLRAFTL